LAPAALIDTKITSATTSANLFSDLGFIFLLLPDMQFKVTRDSHHEGALHRRCQLEVFQHLVRAPAGLLNQVQRRDR